MTWVEFVTAVAWFWAAAATDYLSVVWQEAREQRLACRCANVAVALEGITYLAMIFVVVGWWSVIVASLAGSWVGSYAAVRRTARRDPPQARSMPR